MKTQTTILQRTHVPSWVDVSQGTTRVVAQGGNINLEAPEITTEALDLTAQGNIALTAVNDTYSYQSTREEEGDGWFDRGSTAQQSFQSSTSVGTKISSKAPVQMRALTGDIELTHVNIQAPQLVVEALNGQVQFLQGRNSSQSSSYERSSDVFWQSMRMEQSSSQTYSPCVLPDVIQVMAQRLEVERVRGESLAFLDRLQVQGGSLNITDLDEVHTHLSVDVGGPTAALGAVISIAASLSTWGVGGVTLGATGTLGSVISSSTAAAFSTISSQAALALVSSQGNIGQAAKSLASSQTMKAVLMSSVTAGLTRGVSAQLNIAPINPASTWSQSLAHQSVGAGVKAALSLARGDRASDVLTQGALSTIAQTGMQQGASSIGALYGPGGDLDGLTHKILHGMNGAAAGALMNPGQMSDGAFAGALGAMVAESFAEIAKPDPVVFQATIRDRAAREGVDLRDESARYALVRDELSVVIGAGETVSATVAAVLGKDPTLAALSARNALENNMAHVAALAVGRALVAGAPLLSRAARLAGMAARAKSTMDAADDRGTGVEAFPTGDEVGDTGQREGYEAAPQDRTGADVEGYAPAVPSSTQEGFGIADDAPDMRILTSQEDYADRLNALMASEDLSRIEKTVLLNDLKAVGAVLGDSPAARIIAPQAMQDAKVGITKRRGGESEAAAIGRRAHQNYEKALGEQFDTKVTLESRKRPDAVNWTTREVRELKPDNARAVARGERQVEGYRKELEDMTGESWTSVVDVYRAGK